MDLGTTSVCQVHDAGHIDVKCVSKLPMVPEILATRVSSRVASGVRAKDRIWIWEQYDVVKSMTLVTLM